MERIGSIFQGKRGMMEDKEDTKIDKAISWIVIMGFFVMMYNLFGVCSEEIRELMKHIF